MPRAKVPVTTPKFEGYAKKFYRSLLGSYLLPVGTLLGSGAVASLDGGGGSKNASWWSDAWTPKRASRVLIVKDVKPVKRP